MSEIEAVVKTFLAELAKKDRIIRGGRRLMVRQSRTLRNRLADRRRITEETARRVGWDGEDDLPEEFVDAWVVRTKQRVAYIERELAEIDAALGFAGEGRTRSEGDRLRAIRAFVARAHEARDCGIP